MWGKSTILKKYSKYIRFWYITGELPENMIEDCDIKPYFTPCPRHRFSVTSNEGEDVIDGVEIMMAFCTICTQEGIAHDSQSMSNNVYSPCIGSALQPQYIHPLSYDWAKEEEEESQQILALDNLQPISYSPTIL